MCSAIAVGLYAENTWLESLLIQFSHDFPQPVYINSDIVP